ncbi:MAG TPA: tetratricopeptide repeat protein [Paludibacteraceae bacterium]|nr:tetratricopeptide repeat protein [Paludibacteraceae bacterium]HQB68542.1 tetratricopeptide repeat protein [Paludibacteraceae bacterium]
MKRIIKLVVVILLTVVGSTKADNQLQKAADLYAAQLYEEAAEVYAHILETNKISPELYYNYANACYKSGQLGKAVLNYERALALRPNYEDAKFNLAFVNTQIVDKIELIDTFFLTQWFQSLGKLYTANQWGVISVISFVVALMLALLYVFASHRSWRKVGFFSGLVFLVISFVALSYSFSQQRKSEERAEAIVMVGSMSVKSAPDDSGTELFVLHEGTKVVIKSSLSDWLEIRIADGHVGWVKTSQIERI